MKKKTRGWIICFRHLNLGGLTRADLKLTSWFARVIQNVDLSIYNQLQFIFYGGQNVSITGRIPSDRSCTDILNIPTFHVPSDHAMATETWRVSDVIPTWEKCVKINWTCWISPLIRWLPNPSIYLRGDLTSNSGLITDLLQQRTNCSVTLWEVTYVGFFYFIFFLEKSMNMI